MSMPLIQKVLAVWGAIYPRFNGAKGCIRGAFFRPDAPHGNVLAGNTDKVRENRKHALARPVALWRSVVHVTALNHVTGVTPGNSLKPFILLDFTRAHAFAGSGDGLVERFAKLADFLGFRLVLGLFFSLRIIRVRSFSSLCGFALKLTARFDGLCHR